MIYEVIGGSRSYGLELETSDTDLLRAADAWSFGTEGEYNLIQIPRGEFAARITGERRNAGYLQWLFPKAFRTDNELTRYLRGRREDIVLAQLPLLYRNVMGHADSMLRHADWLYGAYPKRLAYTTLYYHMLARYAGGLSFAEAHVPEAEMRERLLGMRSGAVPLEAAMETALRERAAAERAAGFYERPALREVLEDARAAIRGA